MTLQELFEKFIEYKRVNCKDCSLGNYRAKFRALCRTALDPDMDVASFDKNALQQVYDRYKAAGSGEKTCRDAVTLMKNVLNTGAVLGVCDERVLKVQYDRDGYVGGERLKVYRKDEIQRIAAWLKLNPHFWTLGVYIAVYTGARIGEVCGLRWEDVDFEERTIHVQRTVERGVPVEGRGTVVYINSTKTKSSNRFLPLCSQLERLLRDWSRVSRPEFYIISNSANPIEPRYLRAMFTRVCDATNVRYKGFHSLRHTFATMMLESGADIKSISDILGHSSVEITMDVYSHPSDQSKRNAVNKMFRNLKFE